MTAAHDDFYMNPFSGVIFSNDDFTLEIDDGSVFMKQEGRRGQFDEVEITETYDLIINGREIELGPKERELTREFHTLAYEIIDRAMDIGIDGAKLGIDGVKIAFTALAGVIKMIGPNYDEDDLEREVEAKAELLEEKAELLEERAEVIEDIAEDMENIFYDMEDAIPELADLHFDLNW